MGPSVVQTDFRRNMSKSRTALSQAEAEGPLISDGFGEVGHSKGRYLWFLFRIKPKDRALVKICVWVMQRYAESTMRRAEGYQLAKCPMWGSWRHKTALPLPTRVISERGSPFRYARSLTLSRFFSFLLRHHDETECHG